MAENEKQTRSKLKRANSVFKDRAINKTIARSFIIFIVIVLAFVLGFLVRSNAAFVASLGFPVDESVPSTTAKGEVKTTYDAISERVGEVEDIFKTNSLDELNLAEATKTMLADFVKATGDPFAEYYDPDRYERYIKESADRKYSGIGVLFGDYDGRAYVIDVLSGSEAEARGVAQGDFVQSIDGDSSHVWGMREVIGALARDEGEKVVITWMRPISLDADKGQEFTTTLTCSRYDVENVTTNLEEEVGYIKLKQVTSTSASLVKSSIEDLTANGAQAFVLDLRDNPGGYLTQALDIASLFVPSGVLVGIETNDGTTTRVASGQTITEAPLVVLMNEYTAAATEVLAAALQDNQRATTVGTTTMGKGSVQVVRELSFGGAVRYTAAYYLTPLGHGINGEGLSPNIVVSVSADDENDTQYLVAMDTARSLLES